jgi:ABC-2 type transport system permease protein
MPIFDQGYTHWNGTLSGQAGRWLAITRQGVGVQLKRKWVLSWLFLACGPAVILSGFLMIWGLFEQKSQILVPLMFLFRDLPQELQAGPRGFRTPLWTLAFRQFFDIQLFFAMVLVLFVGPDLISQDLRFKAIPLYLSRPLRRFEYFLGKLGVIAVFLAVVIVVPVVLAFGLGYAFSLDPGVVRDTARLLLASFVYGGVVVGSAGLLMLAFSSLSQNSRHVQAMWLGVWIVSNVAAGVLQETVRADWCPLVSYTANLRRVRDAMIDAETSWEKLTALFGAGQKQLDATMGRGGPGRGPGQALARILVGQRPGGGPPAGPQPPVPKLDQPPPPRRPPERPSVFAPPKFPWQWSAAVLAGLGALSIVILTFQVRTLDRLR